MLYLKNTLGGLSRSLTDSALSSFQGPHRWWKLALFAVLFVLPGGSVGVAVLAWVEHRRGQKKGATNAAAAQALRPVAAAAVASGSATTTPAALATGAPSTTGACQARGDAPCRAAAGKLARQTPSADSRV
ncbi:hypothetical protein PQQ51_30305 [Paraburkholderia xenovorans]|uniref:hypothetical protein n=1 Tax=Paraburkholderia xenovorans TaxID=36873 RepID=UPI0038B993D6